MITATCDVNFNVNCVRKRYLGAKSPEVRLENAVSLQRLARGRPPAHRVRSSWRLWVLQLEGGEWEASDAKAALHGTDQNLTEAERAILRKTRRHGTRCRFPVAQRMQMISGHSGQPVPCRELWTLCKIIYVRQTLFNIEIMNYVHF